VTADELIEALVALDRPDADVEVLVHPDSLIGSERLHLLHVWLSTAGRVVLVAEDD
jgi:hypothetical protein